MPWLACRNCRSGKAKTDDLDDRGLD